MRNFYSLLFSLMLSVFAFGQWSESFESGIPADWTIINQGGVNQWVAGQPTDQAGAVVPAQDGTECARINFDFGGDHDDYLVTPAIPVQVGVNGFLSLYARNGSPTFQDVFEVVVSTGTTAVADFTDVLATNIEPPTDWTNYQFNLNAYAGQTIYVAIHAVSPINTNQELDIDLVESFAGPDCPEISDISVVSNTGDTLTLTWTNGASETTWDVEYGESGFTPTGAPTLDNVTDNPLLIEGLTSDVEYDFYIRADCGGTDISPWVGPFTVTTIINYCAGAQFTDTGGADANYGNSENENWLIAPINPGDRVRVTFTEFNVENGWDFLRVYDGPDNTYPPLHPGVGTADNGFTGIMGTNTTVPATVVSTDPSGSLYFEFESDGVINRPGWVANVVCEPIPTCPDISQLMASNITGESAEISWNAPDAQFSWSIEYGPSGFTQGDGTGTVISGVTDNPYLIEGLDPITDYDFYIQGECADSDFSVWAGPGTFMTGCAIVTPEYSQDFTEFLPPCWEEAPDGTLPDGPIGLGTNGQWSMDGFANNGTTGAAKINLYYTTKDEWLVSPEIDLGDGSTAYELKYDIATMHWGSSTDQEGFSDDDAVHVLIFNNDTWTILESWDNTNTPVYETDRIIPLTGYTGVSRIGFYGTEGTINDSSDVDASIDNFVVREQPACPQPAFIEIDASTDTADVTWLGPDNAVEYIVVYVEAGGDPETEGTTVTPNPTTNSVQITGLDHSTLYDIYITTDCGAEDGLSFVTGPVSFQTDLPNDECVNAVEIMSSPLGETCSTAVAGSVSGATDSGIPGCLGTADDDVWYHFEAISNRHKVTISEIVGSYTDLNFEVFEGVDCDNLNSVFCSDALISTITDLTIGDTYYIRVFTAGSTAESVNFDICVTALMPEAENSSCDTAIAVDANTDLPYENSQYDYVTATGEGGIIEGCAGGTNDGVWYSVLGSGADIIVDVNPTQGYNAEVGIYTTPCGTTPPEVIGCSSNAGTDGLESVTFTSEAGQMYYINIGHYSSVADFPEGDFDIDIYVDTTNVEDLENQLSSETLYPNPTSGSVTYSGDKELKSVVIYGLDGKIVNTSIAIESANAFDISSLQKGVYFIVLRMEDGSSENFKVIKN